MAHLTLRWEGWESMAHDDYASCVVIAGQIGMTVTEVFSVLVDRNPPTEHFIACCLFHLPVEFNDIFEVTPPARLEVAA